MDVADELGEDAVEGEVEGEETLAEALPVTDVEPELVESALEEPGTWLDVESGAPKKLCTLTKLLDAAELVEVGWLLALAELERETVVELESKALVELVCESLLAELASELLEADSGSPKKLCTFTALELVDGALDVDGTLDVDSTVDVVLSAVLVKLVGALGVPLL
jgi:hypothetical protein